MKTLATIIIVAAIIIAIPLIVALFTKNKYAVKREMVINKPKPAVFDYIKYLKNQDNYSKWVMTDPAMRKAYKGTDGTVGFVYAWDSHNKQAGKGEQEIKHIIEGEEVNVEVRFIRPFAGTANTRMTTAAMPGNQTKVTWEMEGSNPYPFNFMNLFMNNVLGKDLGTSLNNLKSILEK